MNTLKTIIGSIVFFAVFIFIIAPVMYLIIHFFKEDIENF